MTQVWRPFPQAEVIVTHSGTDYTLDSLSIEVRRHENGFDTATVVLHDGAGRYSKVWFNKVTVGDAIEIKQRDKSESWKTILDGTTRRVEPSLSENGRLLNVKCDGSGYGLNMMKCGEEYGTESSNATLDTIREMVKDASHGVIPKWTNCLLGSATATGFSYTTYVEAITGSIKYVYFPYKPCDKTINDICDIVQAIKGTNAGPHWIVDTSGRFLLTTVGAHSAAGDNPAQYWPTWWRTDQTGSTLVEGLDFANLRFQHLTKQTNYILYHGRFKRPNDGDFWTENAHALWGVSGSTVSSDAVNYKVGSDSIKGAFAGAGPGIIIYYPSANDLAMDFTKIGGKHNIPHISFWCRRDAACTSFEIRLVSFDGGITERYNLPLQSLGFMPTAGTWYYFSLPVGPYSFPEGVEGFTLDWIPDGILGGDWSEIDGIWFYGGVAGGNQELWVDGLNINGWVLRGARQTAAYSATDPCKMELITDEVAKDDSLSASDDSRLIGRLAYAEYLRQSSTPIVGTFTTPIANDILPGQLVHLHAQETSSGSFHTNKNFRVTRVIHTISDQGFYTIWDVTDDLKNANPRPIPTQLNTLLGAVRPEFQDRQASSIKTREIDITQPILEKTY